MGAAGVLRPFTDDQQEGTTMPKHDPVAEALAATSKTIGLGLKLPPLLERLPDDVRESLDRAILGNYAAAHLARAVNHVLAQHGIDATVTYNTVLAYREHLRGSR